MTRIKKFIIEVTVFIFGVIVAIIAAFNGGIGPEPPRSLFTEIVHRIYYTYFMAFCDLFDVVGLIIAIVLHGIIFFCIAYIVLSLHENRISQRNNKKKRI